MKTHIPAITIGLNLGNKTHFICVLDQEGQIVEQRSITNHRESLRRLSIKYPGARIALEVGSHSPWISRFLKSLKHEVLVANPRKMRAIYASTRKCDELDSLMLARMDPQLLYPIEHSDEQSQRDLLQIKLRDNLVRQQDSSVPPIMKQNHNSQEALKEAATMISAAQEVLLLTHVHPDADAIGALLGLGAALHKNGKQVIMAVDGGVPPELQFLEGAVDIRGTLEDDVTFDLIIALDSDDLPVLGNCGAKAFSRRTHSLVIDHHAFNEFYGTVNVVDVFRVSTTEVIIALFDRIGWDIPVVGSNALLLGMLSDTQLFKTGPVGVSTFKTVQRLIQIGADYALLVEKVFSKYETGYLRLLGEVLSRAHLESHVYWTWVTPEDFDRYGLKQTNRFYAVDDLITDQKARIAATFQVIRDGTIRVSMRAASGWDVGRIADQLGGGGHIQASGCVLSAQTVKEAIEKVIPLLQEEANRQTSRKL